MNDLNEEELAKALARALKALRKYNEYSLQTVSAGTEIPFQTIARYENGENIPSILQAYKLARFYQFPLNDLFSLGATDGIEEDYADILDEWK